MGDVEFEGRLRMRIVGWNAPGGGDRTERDDVAEGEIIRAGMGFGDLVFASSHIRRLSSSFCGSSSSSSSSQSSGMDAALTSALGRNEVEAVG